MNAPRIRHYPNEPWQLLDEETGEPCTRYATRREARQARSESGGRVVHTFADGPAELDERRRGRVS